MSHPAPADVQPGQTPAVIEISRRHVSAETERRQVPRPLWDPASGRFNPVALRAAIVCRGWTVRDFAAAAGISRACLYNALRRRAVSDRTVVRVGAALAGRDPLRPLTEE